jgi:hypothetical protein
MVATALDTIRQTIRTAAPKAVPLLLGQLEQLRAEQAAKVRSAP